jgi:hypothetical protein
MAVLGAFPLLFIPAFFYALFAFGAGAQGMADGLRATAFSMPTAGGNQWVVTWGHLLIIFATLCLFVEILKSARPTRLGMLDNGLSVGVFILCLISFILIPGFGTSEFFIIMLMSLLDFLAGSIIMVQTAQRTVQYDNTH